MIVFRQPHRHRASLCLATAPTFTVIYFLQLPCFLEKPAIIYQHFLLYPRHPTIINIFLRYPTPPHTQAYLILCNVLHLIIYCMKTTNQNLLCMGFDTKIFEFLTLVYL